MSDEFGEAAAIVLVRSSDSSSGVDADGVAAADPPVLSPVLSPAVLPPPNELDRAIAGRRLPVTWSRSAVWVFGCARSLAVLVASACCRRHYCELPLVPRRLACALRATFGSSTLSFRSAPIAMHHRVGLHFLFKFNSFHLRAKCFTVVAIFHQT
jgi:hypothetical protein